MMMHQSEAVRCSVHPAGDTFPKPKLQDGGEAIGNLITKADDKKPESLAYDLKRRDLHEVVVRKGWEE